MIEVINRPFVDEAVDADQLIQLLPKTTRNVSQFRVKRELNAPVEKNGGVIEVKDDDVQINVHPSMLNKAYDKVIELVFGKDKKNVKQQLEAYGTSEKELKEALKLVIAYNTVVALEGSKSKIKLPKTAAQFLQDIKQQKPFNERGRIGNSGAYALAKEMLENLTDDEFEEVVGMISDSKNLAQDLQKFPAYAIFGKKPKELFAIDPEEEKRFFDAKQSTLKGVATQQKAKRRVKGKITGAAAAVKGKAASLKDKAKGAWKAVKDAGQFARGLLA